MLRFLIQLDTGEATAEFVIAEYPDINDAASIPGVSNMVTEWMNSKTPGKEDFEPGFTEPADVNMRSRAALSDLLGHRDG